MGNDEIEGTPIPGEGPRSGECEIRTHWGREQYTIQVLGDLTWANISELLSVIHSIVEFKATAVVLDLQKVRTIDVAALHALYEATRMAASFQSQLRVLPPSGQALVEPNPSNGGDDNG